MIPLWETVLAFSIIAYITDIRTYWILTISAVANAYIDQFTSADDQYLMVTYSSIEFVTCLLILRYGDSHKLYQSIMLFLMLCLHFMMEAALVFDNVYFINSGIYIYGMSGLIILQLMGAGRGIDSVSWFDPNKRKDNNSDNSHCQTSNLAKESKK